MDFNKNPIPIEESEEEMFDLDSVTPIGCNRSVHVNVPESVQITDTTSKPKGSGQKEHIKRILVSLPESLFIQLNVYRLFSNQSYSSLISSLLQNHFNSPEFSDYAEKIRIVNKLFFKK